MIRIINNKKEDIIILKKNIKIKKLIQVQIMASSMK